jgi:hypothetical protein
MYIQLVGLLLTMMPMAATKNTSLHHQIVLVGWKAKLLLKCLIPDIDVENKLEFLKRESY